MLFFLTIKKGVTTCTIEKPEALKNYPTEDQLKNLKHGRKMILTIKILLSMVWPMIYMTSTVQCPQ